MRTNPRGARDAEVVYIYHNTVDATGEDASTEHDVFGACERAVRDICGLVRIATNQIKAARIVVTADHPRSGRRRSR